MVFGVRRLFELNRALLCKWLWQFANERLPLERSYYQEIRFGRRGWFTREVREGYGVGFFPRGTHLIEEDS